MHLVGDIASALNGKLHGDGAIRVMRATEPALAGPNDLAIALSGGFLEQLSQSIARAAVVMDGVDWSVYGLEAAITVPRGRLAMAKLTQALDPKRKSQGVIHETAVVDASAKIDASVDIGPFCVVGPDVEIGSNCKIGAHVSVAGGTVISDDATIEDGCKVLKGVSIGANVWLHANVVIGSHGFSFVTTQAAHVELARKTLGQSAPPELEDPTWHRIHSLGGVVIEADVEVGANSTIDAGTFRPTRIGRGTKIDNLVHVGHNAVVGAHCLLCGQVGIAGSATIGDRTVVGGQAGVADNTTVGADVVIGGASVVLSNVPNGRVMLGSPAVKLTTHIEGYKALRRLPRMLSRLTSAKTGSKPSDD